MFEIPELITLARQINETLTGRIIRAGSLGNSPHKFVWYNRSPREFEQLTCEKQVGEARAKGRWLFIDLNPGYRLVLGEFGGKLLFHPKSGSRPAKYHLLIDFEDGSSLSHMTAMWGAMELYEAGQELERQYIKDMRPTPVEGVFTLQYFTDLIEVLLNGEKHSVKSLLTQKQIIPGLGNSIAQDILFRAHLHPRHALADLSAVQRNALYDAIVGTVREVITKGGRSDEIDLYGEPGGYTRVLDSRSVGRPCPRCQALVQKMQYLGGACYFCPHCQV